MIFERLEHTADYKFRAYGIDIEERFTNAGYAMIDEIYDYKNVDCDKKIQISVEGNDLKQLLYNFLEEILFILDADNFFVNSIKDLKIKEKILSATFIGSKHKDKYKIHGDVKAVTYAEMEITNDYVQVVVDI